MCVVMLFEGSAVDCLFFCYWQNQNARAINYGVPLEARPSNETEYAAVVALLAEMRQNKSQTGGYDAQYRVGVKGRGVRHSRELHGGETTVLSPLKFAEAISTR